MGNPGIKENNIPMAATLREILLAPDVEPAVGAECYQLIGLELADKTGVSGTALKLAYKTVNTFMPGHIEFMVRDLLPDMVDQLDPFWADFRTSGGAEFGDYLTKRGDEVAEALLTVTDARAAASGRPTVIKAYKSVRGNAVKHITAALPRVGALVQKYAGLSGELSALAARAATVHAMGSPPPAARVLDLAHGAAHTHILGALARLRIADHVADQPRSVADLASATGAVPDRLDRLLRAATVLGLVQRTAAGMITMTEVGACLRSGPGSLHDFALMLSAPGQLRPLEYLSEAVRGGVGRRGRARRAAVGLLPRAPRRGRGVRRGDDRGVGDDRRAGGRGGRGGGQPAHRGRRRRARHAAARPAGHRAAGRGRSARPARGGGRRARRRAHPVHRRRLPGQRARGR